jgi:hypothetical protein
MPHIALYGGEQDGQLIPDASAKTRPEIYYAVPLVDDDKLKRVRGQNKKNELRERLGVLAYKFQKEVMREGIGNEYVYVRAPQLDKKAKAQ